MPRSSSRSRNRSSDASRTITDDESEPGIEVMEEESQMQFTQQAPEESQPIMPVRQSDKRNLEGMGRSNRQKAITDVSRLILFKALAGEPIERLKCAKEALADIEEKRITSAVFDEAARNLRNVFGFELRRVPKFMENRKSLPSKYKDRYFVVNSIEDDEAGSHSKGIHSVHPQSSVEKSLLMIILAFAFCKGAPRQDKSRWITDIDLYRLLHTVDENIPEEPPSVANRKVSATQARYRNDGDGGVAQTPSVDGLLEKFVHMDYLLREKCTDGQGSQVTDQDTFQYSMGPRAAMEVGRLQIITFCSEVLDEGEPDPTMLQEIEEEDAEDEVEYEDAQ